MQVMALISIPVDYVQVNSHEIYYQFIAVLDTLHVNERLAVSHIGLLAITSN